MTEQGEGAQQGESGPGTGVNQTPDRWESRATTTTLQVPRRTGPKDGAHHQRMGYITKGWGTSPKDGARQQHKGVDGPGTRPGQTGGRGSTTRPSSFGVRTGSPLSQVWGRKGGQFRGEGK